MNGGAADTAWQLPGTARDGQSITRDWFPTDQRLLAGVAVRETRHVLTHYGHLTECFRTDWQLDAGGVGQVFQTVLQPGGVSAWHVHGVTTDRLFVLRGQMRIVLFDARPDSPTAGMVNQFRCGDHRPMLVVIPPRVYHGVQNTGSEPAHLLNIVDVAYIYENPDHYRLPLDTPHIPFRFLDAPRDALSRA